MFFIILFQDSPRNRGGSGSGGGSERSWKPFSNNIPTSSTNNFHTPTSLPQNNNNPELTTLDSWDPMRDDHKNNFDRNQRKVRAYLVASTGSLQQKSISLNFINHFLDFFINPGDGLWKTSTKMCVCLCVNCDH